MFIIWGFRNKIQDHGATIAATCPRCHNSVVLNHIQIRRWMSIFFVPLIPLGKARRVLVCPICQWSRNVPKEAADLTDEMATITKQWQGGGLDDGAYNQRVEAYWSFATPAGLPAASDASADQTEPPQ